MYFVVGSAVHEAIDAQASGHDPFAAFEAFVEAQRSKRQDLYEQNVGSSPWYGEMEEFEASVDLARCLVRQYFDHYSIENPLAEQGLKYVATEVPFSVPLENGLNFVGTFDGIATDIETESQVYLLENKTADRKPTPENIQFGNQYVGYNWAFRALTGATPSGTLYNGIFKRLIKPPRTLKSGALSVDKQASVTPQSFLAAIQEGDHDPVKYLEYMQFLEDRERNGDDRFFYRQMFTFTNYQLDQWYNSFLEPVSYEIKDAHSNMAAELKVLPNYTSCDGCLVRDLCMATDLGDDVAALREQRYEVKTYGTMEAVDGVTPDAVGSVSDLMEMLNV